MNLLLSPPVAFLAYIPVALVLLGLGRLLAGPASANAVKSSVYGSGEASPTFEAAPGYQPFFLIALFFAVVHLAMLVLGDRQPADAGRGLPRRPLHCARGADSRIGAVGMGNPVAARRDSESAADVGARQLALRHPLQQRVVQRVRHRDPGHADAPLRPRAVRHQAPGQPAARRRADLHGPGDAAGEGPPGAHLRADARPEVRRRGRLVRHLRRRRSRAATTSSAAWRT